MALLTACAEPSELYIEQTANGVWSDEVEFTIPNTDTTSQRKIELFVRTNTNAQQGSYAIDISTLTPDSTTTKEQIYLNIKRGSKVAAIANEQIATYRSGVVLSHKGEYKLRLTTTNNIDGIEAVGIVITGGADPSHTKE